MPAEIPDAAQAKRNRLPFKPPRRQSSALDGSSSTTSKPAASKTTARKRTSTTAASTSKPKTAQKPSSAKTKAANSKKRKAQSISSESDEGSDGENENEDDSAVEGAASRSRSGSPLQEPDYILAEIVTNDQPRDIESGEPGIPPKLLTRLLHHHFQNPKTKIAKDANEVVAKYMDIFVREALARAAYERAEGNAANGDRGGSSVADGFLEVCCF